MPKRSGPDGHSKLRQWRHHWLVPRHVVRRLLSRMGDDTPMSPVRSRGTHPSAWAHEPVELAVRSIAEEHEEGWLVGLAELADRLEIDVEGLLASAVAFELRGRFGKGGGLDLRGKRSEFTRSEARSHLEFLDAVADAARAAAGAPDPVAAAMNVLGEQWLMDPLDKERSELLPGSPAEHLRQVAEQIAALLHEFPGKPAALARRLLKEREARLRVPIEYEADLRKNLTANATRGPTWEGSTYAKVRKTAEDLLRRRPK